MRYVVAWMIACLWSAFGAVPSPDASTKSLTLLFGFDGPYSEKSLTEMKRELATLLKDSGLRVDWRERSGLQPEETFQNLVVVKFRGKCRMEPVPYLYDERGPLAFTYDSEGSVLPFSEIECDHVRSSVDRAMWGGDHARSDQLLGRALARVLAHELYHVLSGRHSHGETGVAKRSLTGSQLIADHLKLSPADLRSMISSPATAR